MDSGRGRGDGQRGRGGRGRGGEGRGRGGRSGRGNHGSARPHAPASSAASSAPTPLPDIAVQAIPQESLRKLNGEWSSLGLAPPLLRAVEEAGYVSPTDIQLKSIPAGISGRDVIAAAQTGTGKTAAFLLPVLHRLMAKPRLNKSTVLVITPTRELAIQIEEHSKALSKFIQPPVRCATIFGGVGMGPQEQAFRQKVDILIACPGRLLDHLQNNSHYAHLNDIEYLVIDEADRMLDMGFLPDLRKIFAFLNPSTPRQTLFFSATMPPLIVDLAKSLTKEAHTSNLERVARPAESVTQSCWEVQDSTKQVLLLALVTRNVIDGRAIVFCRTKHRAKKLTKYMNENGVACAEIHGNRSQVQRNDALDGFKAGKYRLLIATDVLARGIDISELGHVVNFDVPHIPEDYIHRVGRTGRAEQVGDAFTFVSPDEGADWRAIERAVHTTIPKRVLGNFDYNTTAGAPLETPIEERMEQHRIQMKAAREKAAAKRIATLTAMGYTFTPDEISRFATVKGIERLNQMIADAKEKGIQPMKPPQTHSHQQPKAQQVNTLHGQGQPQSQSQSLAGRHSHPQTQLAHQSQSHPQGQALLSSSQTSRGRHHRGQRQRGGSRGNPRGGRGQTSQPQHGIRGDHITGSQ